MSFTYVKIPADSNEPIEELTASKAGGLDKDELLANARSYFCKQAGADYESCDITALSVPMTKNDYHAVSLYASDYGLDARENARATQLVTACGHGIQEPIRGDVFVGRASDNEMGEIDWERVDFTKDDADPTSDWCRLARSAGGGGGQGGKTASSLGNLVQQQMGAAIGKPPPQIVAPTSGTALYGTDGGAPVKESWGTWTQKDDEVELKLSIPAELKSKDCKVTFKKHQLTVVVNNDTKVEGTLFGAVIPDECTYTIENMSAGRELCITLTKADEGTTWSWLTAAK